MSNYEHLLSLARSRRSVRQFADRRVSREDILRVLEAARWAPSNHNRQPWKFIVLADQGQIVRLADAVRLELSRKLESLPQVASAYAGEFTEYATFFAGAPVVIAVLHKKPVGFSTALLQGVEHADLVSGEPLSTAMAVQNLLLAAHALGLGSCMLTAPLIARDLLVRDLNLPPGHDLTCFVALGYPAEKPTEPRRKSIEQIAEFREDPRK